MGVSVYVCAGQMSGQLIAENCELQMAPPAGGHFIRFDFSKRKKDQNTKISKRRKNKVNNSVDPPGK